MNEAPKTDYDVIVIGGAFAGASLATLLRRWQPESRVLLVERGSAFRRKVGEATVEVSAFFLHKVLGLYDPLSRGHLAKHGLRYWFTDRPDRQLSEMTEIGPRELPSLPSFQLDRSLLDQDLLEMAVAEGCELLRPATVKDIELGWPQSRLTIENEAGERRELTARWVVDASGRAAFLSRRLGLHRRLDEHPTGALWGRWRGVADIDGPEVLGNDLQRPKLPDIASSRRLATNHFMGYGWWCWVIPLVGGETSIGLVYNKELFEPPGEGSKQERYEAFVRSHPGLSELLAQAELVDGDFNAYHRLPYWATQYMDHGWALVGDAAAFIDPYYSPGLDHVAMSVYATARLIEAELAGELAGEGLLAQRIAHHNGKFERSYKRWFEGLYEGKYELMGDAELTACAFLVDTALYYLGIVNMVYGDIDELENPTFGAPVPATAVASRAMRFFNRRLNRLARFRRQVGIYGRRNVGWRFFTKAPGLGRRALPMLRQGLGLWLRLELGLLGYRLRHWRRLELSQPVSVTNRPLSERASSPA